MSKPFQFKEFSVNQDKCAMKIGTDGVLLGAWTPVQQNPFSVLDIGSGTGVLALMLAQRSYAEIVDAIEIDDEAYEQCVDNFEQSPWGDRLFCYHASIQEFAEEIDDSYDLIVCNPPFYSEDYKTENVSRDLARFQDAMPFNHLVASVSKLLSETGIFSVVVPFSEATKLIELAKQVNLFPNSRLNVKGNPLSSFKRSYITFSFKNLEITTKELVIETERHQFTADYVTLTKDFYLKM